MFPIDYYLLLCIIFLCTILYVERTSRGIPVADMARQVERGQMHPAIEVAECGMGHDMA